MINDQCSLVCMHINTIYSSLGDKPISTEVCFTKPCFKNYEYRALGMSECSRSCLGGKYYIDNYTICWCKLE